MEGNSTYGSFKTPCTSDVHCEDGLFLQHLVRNKLWSYSRLPLDGLKSIVFTDSSPTLCVASGNVWFDYPKVEDAGCVSHKTLYVLSLRDASKNVFDWQSFNDGDRLCLRLSNAGFSRRSENISLDL